MSDGVRRGGKHAIIDADEEQKMRDLGMPVRCCDYWPECSHDFAWVEAYDARTQTIQAGAEAPVPLKKRGDRSES